MVYKSGFRQKKSVIFWDKVEQLFLDWDRTNHRSNIDLETLDHLINGFSRSHLGSGFLWSIFEKVSCYYWKNNRLARETILQSQDIPSAVQPCDQNHGIFRPLEKVSRNTDA